MILCPMGEISRTLPQNLVSSNGESNFTHSKEQQHPPPHNNKYIRNETLTIFFPITYFNPLSLKIIYVECSIVVTLFKKRLLVVLVLFLRPDESIFYSSHFN